MTAGGSGVHVRIAIIGSGFGGLGAAIRLKQAGAEDFVVLERADDIGGTWRDNTYPGCACDVESHLYSFSFAPNPEWSQSFSPQSEIQAYLKRCAEQFGILPHVRLNHEVREATWDGAAQRWRIETSQGTFTAWLLVMATGAFSDPAIPELPGLERFGGTTFHSARWDHSFDLDGRRVAVIGTGASAIQFVPEIQPKVAQLYLFQRTPPWILPRYNRSLSPREHRLFRRFPALQRAIRAGIYLFRESFILNFRHPRAMQLAQRLALWHMKRSVPDPALRAKLLPNWTMGCKHVLLSNDYLPALMQPNVEVVTEAITEVRAHSVVSADGIERQVDTIIFGTGFHATDPVLARHIHGRDNRTLAKAWAGSPKAHVGTTVAGFPNFFILLGPNTGLGHTSVVFMIEAQIEHFLSALHYMQRHGASVLEPCADAQARFVAEVEERMCGTVWTAGGCASWYLDATGRNSTLWPDVTWRFRRRVAQMRPEEYVMTRASAAA